MMQYVLTPVNEMLQIQFVWLEHRFKYINSIFVRGPLLQECRKNQKWNW